MREKRKKLIHYLESDHHPYKKLFEEHSDAIYIIDAYGDLAGSNHGCTELFGYGPEELNRMSLDDLVYTEDIKKVSQYFIQTKNGNPQRREFRIRAKNGEVKTITTDAVPICPANTEVLGIFVIGKDVTDQRETEMLVRKQDRKFRSLIRHSSDIITIINRDNEIIYRSPSTEKVLGYKSGELSNQIFSIVHPNDIERGKEIYEEVYQREGHIARADLRLRHRNGNWCDFLVSANNLFHDEDIKGIVVNYRDITEIKNAHRKIHYMAHYDHLTDLPNRRHLENQFEYRLEEAKKHQTKLAVMFIDVDRFKIINDTFGHVAGDQILKEIAKRLKAFVSQDTVVARWAGDEFILLVSNIRNEKAVKEAARKVRECFDNPLLLNNYEIFVTVSMGISIYPDAGNNTQSLIKNADMAMYQTKKERKNSFKVFSPGINIATYKSFSLQNDLNKVIEKKQLELYYQPKVDVQTNEVIGAEALIRWNHPEWGMISPDEFIPFAEESGLIIPIGEWVIQEVCRQIKRWQESGIEPVKVAINFSVLQFLQSNLVDTITAILLENQIEGKWIEVEITESVILEREVDIISAVAALEEIGIQVALDDFGTGYSSLSYLTKYKFDTIKLDKSFLKSIHTDQESKAIIKFITDLAKQLKMKVVAEGVEEEEQLDILRQLKCDEFQGYLFSKPRPVNEFEKLLESSLLITEDKNQFQ